MDAHRKFDVVVFGATGFTGQRVLKELVRQGQGYDRDMLLCHFRVANSLFVALVSA